MPIYKGAKQITKVYQGETEIDKVYRGASKVYGADKGTEIIVSGNPLVLTNVAKEKPLDTLEINGKTEQVQLSGKNLFNVDEWLANNNFTVDENGFIAGTQKASEIIWRNNNLLTSRFTLSFDVQDVQNKSLFFVFHFTDGTVQNYYQWEQSNTHCTVTSTVNKTVDYIYRSFGNAGTFKVKNIQIEQGTSATLYELYCGGIPSPNPDYPQEIVNVNSLEVVQSGANLIPELDTNNFQYAIYLENERGKGIIENGIFKISTQNLIGGTDTAFSLKSKDFIKLPKNKMLHLTFEYKTNMSNYTIQRATIGDRLRDYRTQIVDENNNVSTLNQYPTTFIGDEQWHVFSSTINTLNSENYKIYIGGDSPNFPPEEGYYLFIQNIQLSLSDVENYELYKPIHIATIDGIELTKWDKVVKRNGVWGVSKNHYEYTLNKVNVFYDTSNPNGNIFYFTPTKYNHRVFLPSRNFCNKFIPTSEPIQKMPLYSVCGSSGAEGICWICLPFELNSVSLANEYLANNPAKLIYPTVDEQSFTPLSQTIQDQLNALQIYKPTTIVSNNAECEMSAKYLCYLDNVEAMLTNLYQNDLSEVLK